MSALYDKRGRIDGEIGPMGILPFASANSSGDSRRTTKAVADTE
jgi:hypothetical protein